MVAAASAAAAPLHTSVPISQVAEAEVLMVSLFVRTVTDQTRAKFDGLSAGACAGPDGSFGPLRKAPRFVRRAMPKASDAASADADPR